MAEASMSHDWDLFATLICYTTNIWLPKGKKLTVKKVHPFLNRAEKNKPFDRGNWNLLKEKIQERQR